MKLSATQVSGKLAAAVLIAALVAFETSAQTVDVTGAWIFRVTAGGTSTAVVTLEQNGENLAGRYSAEGLGDVELSGTVQGSLITFTFSVSGGALGQVTYSGTIQEGGSIVGTMDVGGGLRRGTFNARRSENQGIQVDPLGNGAEPPVDPSDPVLTPMTVRPEITNTREVQQALMRSYPSNLRRDGVGGTVVVWFHISEAGDVLETRVAHSSGHAALDAAALRVADVFEFTPAQVGNERKRVWIQFPITFQVRRPG